MNSAEMLMADAPVELTTPAAEPAPAASRNQSLRDCVEQAMDNYFKNLEGQSVRDVYELVMAEVEAPMLEIVMKYTRHNQTKAAELLGLNRGTLRKKLKQYGQL